MAKTKSTTKTKVTSKTTKKPKLPKAVPNTQTAVDAPVKPKAVRKKRVASTKTKPVTSPVEAAMVHEEVPVVCAELEDASDDDLFLEIVIEPDPPKTSLFKKIWNWIYR